MSDVVWSQHPSMRSRAGAIAGWMVVAIAGILARWWIPALLAACPVLDPVHGIFLAAARWSWLAAACPAIALVHAWIASRLVRYDLSADRLLISQGLLLRRMDNLELYRVRDLHLELPLTSRLLGVGNIVLDTVDHTSPVVTLRGVRDPVDAFNRIRASAEASRRRAGIAGVT
jgi:hypothetical protein